MVKGERVYPYSDEHRLYIINSCGKGVTLSPDEIQFGMSKYREQVARMQALRPTNERPTQPTSETS